jgi:hypothetical protein
MKTNTNKMINKKNYQSPSLTIMKPNLNSIFSIFNRIFGLILFIIILFILFLFFYLNIININFLETYGWYNKYIYLFFGFLNIKLIVYFFISIFFIICVSYHLIYSSFKIFTKSEKIYQIISSHINIINKLYLYLLKIIFILILFLILYISYTYHICYIYNVLINIYFISIIILKILFILILQKIQ